MAGYSNGRKKSGLPAVQVGKYHASAELAQQIEAVQRGLDFASGQIRHLHIVGPPGVGKTRLALEVSRAPDLGPLLVYFDSSRSGIVDVLARVRVMPGTSFPPHESSIKTGKAIPYYDNQTISLPQPEARRRRQEEPVEAARV